MMILVKVFNALCMLLSVVDKYFVGVTCYLVFNVCNMCGSLIAAVVELVISSVAFFCSFLKIVTSMGTAIVFVKMSLPRIPFIFTT